jgi:hypothetical protein
MVNRLKKIIKEQLILEKKFAEISANITISFELHHTPVHSKQRQWRHVKSGGDRIYDADLKRLLDKAKDDIVFHIVQGDIVSGVRFIVTDEKSNLNIVVEPEEETPYVWKLFVITTMINSDFRVGLGQLIIKA